MSNIGYSEGTFAGSSDLSLADLASGVKDSAQQIENTLGELQKLTGFEEGKKLSDGAPESKVNLGKLTFLTTRLGIENAINDMNAAAPKAASKVVTKASQALGSS